MRSRVTSGAVFMEFLYFQYHIHIVFICAFPALLFAVSSRRNGVPVTFSGDPSLRKWLIEIGWHEAALRQNVVFPEQTE
jgi:hypothetical protein